MPSKKNRRKYANSDWEASETDESYTNKHNHNIANPADAGGAGENGDTNGNGYTNNHAGGARSNEGKVSNSSQPKRKVSLGPWTFAVGETLQTLKETQRKLNNLQTMFMLHAKDVERVDETSRMLHQLKEDCKQKDTEMDRQETTILTLTNMQIKAKAELALEAAQIEKDQYELKLEKEKHDKRVTLVAVEERHKVNQEIEKLTRQHDEIYKKREQELEDYFAKKRDENNRRAEEFKTEREKLSTAVKEQDTQIKAQAQKLKESKEQYDLLVRAKNSIRKDMEDREAELAAVKKEFALDPRPMDYFVDSFAKIQSQIEKISEKYFHCIEGKEPEKVHEELAAADPLFESVPIDDSDDSRDLRVAHAQRVISQAICEEIWKPFGSEFTTLQPDSSSVLGKILDEIERSDHGGRTATFWNARTMRALKSLQANSATSRDPETTGYLYPARTGSVISKVFILSPLFDESQNESLRMDLVKLVNSAVDVWDNGQAGGSNISVSLVLDRAQREEWRSQLFDPACEGDETNPDLTSRTHPRIFPLFPRVLAPRLENSVNRGNGPPGSWPEESKPIVIHFGKGLPDWSPLVVRGQNAEKERKNDYTTAFENMKKELQSKKRGAANGRRASRGSVSSGSPSEQWKRAGVREMIENR